MPSTITEGSSSYDSSDVDGSSKVVISDKSDEVSGYTWQRYDS